jgi:hypothetical protein
VVETSSDETVTPDDFSEPIPRTIVMLCDIMKSKK